MGDLDTTTLWDAIAWDGGSFDSGFDSGFAILPDGEVTNIPTKSFPLVVVWFDQTGTYDGTVYFEISLDDGTVWFPIEGYALEDATIFASSIASPDDADIYVIPVPSHVLFRVRIDSSSASQGSVTVYARRAYGIGRV